MTYGLFSEGTKQRLYSDDTLTYRRWLVAQIASIHGDHIIYTLFPLKGRQSETWSLNNQPAFLPGAAIKGEFFKLSPDFQTFRLLTKMSIFK